MLKWLQGSALQASNDAFKESEIQTGLINLSRTAYRIRLIEFQLPDIITSATTLMDLSLTRKSMTAVPNLNANSLIAKISLANYDATAVGIVKWEYAGNSLRLQYERDLELVIVEDPIYFQFDTGGTASAQTARVRIGYESRNITETERLALIAASLA